MIPDILTNPNFRPRGVYEFKVAHVDGADVYIRTLDGKERKLTFKDVDPKAFAEQYNKALDRLYVGINMDGFAFLFIKETPVAKWHDII